MEETDIYVNPSTEIYETSDEGHGWLAAGAET